MIGMTHAFAPVRSTLSSRSTSALQLRLDDSWDDLTQTLAASSKYTNVVDIYQQTLRNLQWKTLFSKDWFGVIQSFWGRLLRKT